MHHVDRSWFKYHEVEGKKRVVFHLIGVTDDSYLLLVALAILLSADIYLGVLDVGD